jgi:hypothetical protein
MADTNTPFTSGPGNRTPGYLKEVNVVSAAGVVTNAATNYYLPEFVRTGSANSHVVVANRIYFNTIYLAKQTIIRRVKVDSGNTVTTGNMMLGIYSNNPSTGLPDTLLYSSGSFTVSSGYGSNIAGSDAGLITLPPGFYHLAAVYSTTPIMFGNNGGNVNYAQYGSRSHASGVQNIVPWIDYGSFALPSSTSGLTFYFHDAAITGGTSPLRLEFGVTGA